jgi:biotin carboxyl carrier protein
MKHTVEVDGRRFTVAVGDLRARPIIAEVDGQRFEVWPSETPSVVGVTPVAPAATPHAPVAASASSARVVGSTNADTRSVPAPLPGVIGAVHVQPGSQVVAGQELVMIEAMKMKNTIRAPRAGRVETVLVSVGQRVQHGDPLLRYAAD